MLVLAGKINVVAGSHRTRDRGTLHLEFAFAADDGEVFGGGVPVPGYRTTRGEFGENNGWSFAGIAALRGERHTSRQSRKRRKLRGGYCCEARLVLAHRAAPPTSPKYWR